MVLEVSVCDHLVCSLWACGGIADRLRNTQQKRLLTSWYLESKETGRGKGPLSPGVCSQWCYFHWVLPPKRSFRLLPLVWVGDHFSTPVLLGTFHTIAEFILETSQDAKERLCPQKVTIMLDTRPILQLRGCVVVQGTADAPIKQQ
jgi:hypothetical protein